ncbi:DUF4232 domain-containing protein [Streptomyces sp. NBC_00289]|uniref:DUF4232 domain-containing protein n=1 Tax=Streptomyces sp. NBC_00289 TaxID=2975703 RepID=UPI003245129C
MRAIPITVTALAAALLLTACNGGDSADDSAATQDSKPAGQGGSACAIDGVAVQVGPANAAPAAGDTGNVPVTLTNRGAACTLNGLPAVTLHAGSTSAAVAPDQAAKVQKLTLAKDAAVSFTLTYVRGEAGGEKSLAVQTGTFSLPGATATHSFAWSYGDVALKGAKGEPDASVSAFQQAGD